MRMAPTTEASSQISAWDMKSSSYMGPSAWKSMDRIMTHEGEDSGFTKQTSLPTWILRVKGSVVYSKIFIPAVSEQEAYCFLN